MPKKVPFDRITTEPGKMGGQPCIRGMRITVRRVIELLATYENRDELLAEYPDLDSEDLQQAPRIRGRNAENIVDSDAQSTHATFLTAGLTCTINP